MFEAETRSDAILISVKTDVDIATVEQLRSVIALAESSSERPIVLSLVDCPYCDSTALSLFIRTKKRLGQRFAIVVPPHCKAYRLFEITALTTEFPVYPTFEAAASSFVQTAS